MNIIPQTTTYQLQEHNAVNGEVKTIETADDRESALARFDERISRHPVRYRSWTAYRLVLIGGDR